MTKNQLSAAISSLLKTAGDEVAQAGVCDVSDRNSWVIHMTASKISMHLAEALMAARDAPEEYPNGEKNNPKL